MKKLFAISLTAAALITPTFAMTGQEEVWEQYYTPPEPTSPVRDVIAPAPVRAAARLGIDYLSESQLASIEGIISRMPRNTTHILVYPNEGPSTSSGADSSKE